MPLSHCLAEVFLTRSALLHNDKQDTQLWSLHGLLHKHHPLGDRTRMHALSSVSTMKTLKTTWPFCASQPREGRLQDTIRAARSVAQSET